MNAKPGFEQFWNLVDEVLIFHQPLQDALEEIEDCIHSVDFATPPQCAMIVGESGVGKSTLIEEIERRYPTREENERTVRTVVAVEVDDRVGKLNLPAWTLKALGDPRATKGAEWDMTSRIFDLAEGLGVKLFMFDESQHLVEKEKGKALRSRANWFKELTDTTKAGIVLFGMPSLMGLTAADPQIKGRLGTPIILPRFDWKVPEQKEEFLKILYGFDVGLRRHFDMPALVDADMAFRCYCACGGLMRPLARTLRAAVRRACKEGSRVITLEDLASANYRHVADIASLLPQDRPFSREFDARPTDKVLEAFSTVGSRVEEPMEGTTNRPVSTKKGPFKGKGRQ